MASTGMDIKMQLEMFYVKMMTVIKDKGVTLTEKEVVLLMIDGFQDKLLLLKVLKYIHRDKYVVVDPELKAALARIDSVDKRLEEKRRYLLNNSKKWCAEVANVLSAFGQLINDFYGNQLPIFQYAKEIDATKKITMTSEEEVTLGVEYAIAIKAREQARTNKALRELQDERTERRSKSHGETFNAKVANVLEEESDMFTESQEEEGHKEEEEDEEVEEERIEEEDKEEEEIYYQVQVKDGKKTSKRVCINCDKPGCFSSTCPRPCRYCT